MSGDAPAQRSCPCVAIIGLGEVGTCFAKAFLDRGGQVRVASRRSPRSHAAATSLGLMLEGDAAAAVADADLVLLTVTSGSLREVVASIAGRVRNDALIADLTASSAGDTRQAASMLPAGSLVDVAIMGAVSLHGVLTPLLAAGAGAERFAALMNGLGFRVEAWRGSAVGDASDLKLLRSIFTKGLEAVVIESMLAAEALGLRHELTHLLGDYDKCALRDHIDMYLRTHPAHAERRLPEMVHAESQALARGLPSLTTRAAIERYQRTIALKSTNHPTTHLSTADQAIAWLLELERDRGSQLERERDQ